jgi:hypothetical protein
MDTLSVPEALRFFGLDDVAELERIVLEHDIDAEVDDDGELVAIAAELREPLFEEHRRRHGHRPDDPEQVAKAHRAMREFDEEARRRRAARRTRLRERHAKRTAYIP